MNDCSPDRAGLRDVRMRGFESRTDVTAVIKLLQSRLMPLGVELVDLHQAAGRVLASDVISECAVPAFDRAAMDGYALRAGDTLAAGQGNPLEFVVMGQALPARPFPGKVEAGHAVRVMTGAPLPEGADAVVPAEATTEVGDGRVCVREPVASGRHVGRRGEDIEAGATLLKARRVLRPQDVGVLASVGATPVTVYRRPSAAILVTGDELLPAGSKPEGFRIVDSNSVMLEALLRRDGAASIRIQMIPDQGETIRNALLQSPEDVILVSGGSSVGVEDHAPGIVADIGELCVHGVAMRPASPTGLGFIESKAVFLLPGNPVASLCAYDFFAGLAVRRLGARNEEMPYRTCNLPLAGKIASVVGRTDYVRVRIEESKVRPVARSGASVLSSTTRADGFVIIPPEIDGYREGEQVQVHLYDNPSVSIP